MDRDSWDILIVEDNPGDARLIREILSEGTLSCREIVETRSLVSALEMARARSFDIIILDLNLPDSTGLDTLKEVHATAQGNVPIIVLTGLSDEHMGNSAIGGGAEDYLIKGEVTPSGLSRSIRYAIERKKMEYKLRESEERYRTIFSNSTDGFFLTEPGGGILYVNPAGCRMFGRTEEEIRAIGRSGILDPTDPRLARALEIRAKTGLFSGELTGVRADGTKFPIEASSVMFTDSMGRLRTSITIRDISERLEAERALKESEDFTRSTLNGLSAHIAIVDGKGTILAVNRAWREFCARNGCSPEKTSEGANYIDVCERTRGDDEKTARVFLDGLGRILRDREGDFELQYPCHSPEEQRWFIARITPFPGEGPARAVIAHENITRRKAAEEALQAYKEHLEELVRHRTAELEKARGEAVAASRAKSVFLATMSHEIRTPLNAILGFSQLLMKDPDIDRRTTHKLATINRSGEHLLSLINDILEFSKIEAGRMECTLSTFDLHELMRDMEAMFRYRAEAKGLRLSFELGEELPGFITADEGKLRQIIINLLGNAVKFTNGGDVRLRSWVEPANDSELTVHIEVEDTGPGISDEDRKNIFEAFNQSRGGAQAGGTGLGLALSRQYARLMDGDLVLDEGNHGGSRFIASIRVKTESTGTRREGPKLGRVIGLTPGQSFKVLVVDDNEESRFLIKEMLGTAGFEFEEAVDGKEAVEKFMRWSPDIILMDMRMPGTSGYQATLRIKETKKGEKTPIVAVTASAFEEEKEKAFAWGVDGYLRKPFRQEELFECIRAHLNAEFEYEEGADFQTGMSEENPAGLSLKRSLESLPVEVKDRLLTLAKDLDQDGLLETVALVEKLDADAAAGLMAMVREFQYEKLIAALGDSL